ncbi:hypothetical protein [Pseudomonas tussilaginis]|uniref:hypothetical protein n=1 Tax=Pseudomonas sp. 5 TaxID=1619949 RepID=UPI0005EBC183|nr:hypothetical protein [Pseudomonas sp. 5]KJK04661.1 hypothetical protein UB47_23290 [Pseudomonas sp. 5]
MKQKNSTFRGAEPTWANACVGNNGSPSYVEYSLGFSKAANLLISAVLNNRSTQLTTDAFVYPICFNMRHSVELRLKGAISSLHQLAELKQKKLQFNLKGTHDLNKIWTYFKTESAGVDDRFTNINQMIEPTILDIAEVDPTGQTFRYPYSMKSVKHLTDVPLINFGVLLRRFRKLEADLDELLKLYEWLTIEYSHSKHTKIQRNKLFALANDLPPRSTWGADGFDTVKQRLREKYLFSSNQLTKAIKYIEGNHSLASIIGIEKPLLGVTTEDIEGFVNTWMKDNEDIKKTYTNENSLEVIDMGSLIKELLNQPSIDRTNLKKFATPETTAGLHALFYFAYDFNFTEHYESIYARDLHNMRTMANRDHEYLENELLHVYKKSNFLHHLIQSLFVLGHARLAEKIIATHEIEDVLKWISKARNGTLVQHPEFAQYPNAERAP